LPALTPVHGGILVRGALNGVTAAEFSIQGLPSNQVSASYTAVANPALLSATGNPLGSGARVVFSGCQTDGMLLLYDVTLVSQTAFTGTVTFQPLDPSHPTHSCPVLFGCDQSFTCTQGTVVSRPGLPTLVTPTPGATEVAPNTHLIWSSAWVQQCACISYPASNVYLGTAPNPPLVGGLSDQPSEFNPGLLQPATTYYWRVEDCYCTGCTTSAEGSFRTATPLAALVRSWGTVKNLYKD